MRHIVADIETDGLLDQLTTIHSLVLRDLETNTVVSCTDRGDHSWYNDPIYQNASSYRRTNIAEGLALLAAAERVYFHNGIKFDIPAIQKVYPWFTIDPAKIRDTLVIAQMRWAHIYEQDALKAQKGQFPGHLCGSHSLEAWGHRLGEAKGEYTDWCKANGIEDVWAEWRPEMQTYCEQDTLVGLKLVEHIRKFAPPQEAIETEHDLAWYLAQQERNGVPFDMAAAIELQATLVKRRQELGEQLKAEFGWWFADNKQTVPKKTLRYKAKDGKPPVLVTEGAAYTKLKIVEFNPGSRHHIIRVLKKHFGWEPLEFTKTGEPKLDEDTLESLDQTVPAAKLIVEYLTVCKRLGQLSEGDEAWFNHATMDGPEGGKLTGLYHIHGRVKQNHAVTHRAAHASPNLAQVPKVTSPYGEECRALFTVPEGWVLIGADASGLELRCLAHYMALHDGGAYGRTILEGRNEDGTDIHSVNRNALGLDGKPGRDIAKTFIYAFLYGAGDEKLGRTLKPEAGKAKWRTIGKRAKKRFLEALPALAKLISAVKAKAKEKHYLNTVDGRRVYIRSDHAALNSLLQTAGAIICKRWIVEFNRRLTREFGPQGWRGKWAALLWVHDEVQLAVRPEIADRVCEILVESIRSITQHYSFRIPLDGEAKVGRNWKETH